MAKYEVPQATGAQTQIIYCKETDWGVSPTTGYKKLNIVGGETLDDSVSTYESGVIRPDRMRNPTVRGTRRPGGSLPLEMAPKGISQFLWHLLGGDVTVTPGPVAATNQVQTVTLTNASGGTFTLTLGGITTAALNHNAADATVQAALEAIVGEGNVGVSLGGSIYTVTFQGDLAGMDVTAMTCTSSLTGTTPTIAIAIATPAVRAIPAGKYKHVIKGSTSLPAGFTLEKGFLDLGVPKYFVYDGGRVSRFSMSANVDAIVSGSIDVMFRRALPPAAATVSSGGAPADAPVVSAFTAVQAGIYRDGVKLSVCQSLSLSVDNGMQDNSFVLGSTYRQNLKPGTRRTDGNASFLFQDTVFYDAAMAGTNLSMKVLLADNLDNSIEFLMPAIQLLPQDSSPKISSDGPLTIPANFEAVPNAALGSDIQVTIISDEATINY